VKVNLLKTRAFVISGLLLTSSAVPSVASAAEIQLRPVSNGTIETAIGHKKQDLVAEQITTFKLDEPALIRLDKKVPMILVPVGEGRQQITIDSLKVDEVLNAYNQGQANVMLSEILAEIVDIQQSVQQKKLDQAYRDLLQLQAKYPEVTFLEFLKASILLVMGKKAEAEKTAEAAVKKFPSYKGGKLFLDVVKGKKE
jgi:hypothetical protein